MWEGSEKNVTKIYFVLFLPPRISVTKVSHFLNEAHAAWKILKLIIVLSALKNVFLTGYMSTFSENFFKIFDFFLIKNL
jgi:putative effector of murein hydrolase LrgA (UPF0299 family)